MRSRLSFRTTTRFATALMACALVAAACGDDPPEPTPAANSGPNNAVNNTANNVGENNTDPNSNNTGSSNRPPELERIGSKRAQVGMALSFRVEASDPDGDNLMFSVFGDLPEGAKFDKLTHQFSWTPSDAQLGELVILTFAVSDGTFDDRETIQLEVVQPGGNAPPEITDPGDQILRVDERFELQLEATDPDGDELAYRIDGPAPAGSEVDKNTGLFTWTPQAADQGGSFQVLFIVSDSDAEASVRVRMVVSELELGLGAIGFTEVRLNETATITLPIENPAELPVTCSTVGMVPDGSSFDAQACVFTWTPTDVSLVGRAFEVVFQVSAVDGGEDVNLVGTATIAVLAAAADNNMPNNMPNNNPDACAPDASEPNDSREAATVIDGPSFSAEGLYLCEEGDRDLFAVTVMAGEQLEVTLSFEHDAGDLDMLLYLDDEEEPFQSSTGVLDTESIVIPSVPQGGTVYIEIFDILDTRNTYSLSVERSAGTECPDDGQEPNDARADATVIEADHSGSYTLCPNNEDFFAVMVPEGMQLRANIAFDAANDLDLQVLAPTLDDTWESRGTRDTEEVLINPVPEAGMYIIRVNGWQGASDDYNLTVEVLEAVECVEDGSEPNDDKDGAKPLARDEEIDALHACGDQDWFSYTVPSGSEILAIIDGDDVSPLTFRLFAADGTTLLVDSELDADNMTRSIILAPDMGGDRDVFFVIGEGVGEIYDLGVIAVP